MAVSLQMHAESLRSVFIEMLYCPDGPDTDCETGEAPDNSTSMATGSAFIYRLDGKDHLVTARHNVTGRRWQTNEFLGKYHTEPNYLRVTFFKDSPEKWEITPSDNNPQVGNLRVLIRACLVPLLDEDWNPVWKQHAVLGGDMDVVDVPFDPPDEVTIMSWEKEGPRTDPAQAPWPIQLFPGEDVFVVGYPDRLSVGPIIPLWIRGTIASDPLFPYSAGGKSYPLWLIDARTRRGQSGAPVMRYRPPGAPVFRNDGQLARTIWPDSQLLGVYSGRTSDESDLGFVWSIDEVDKICRNGVPGSVS